MVTIRTMINSILILMATLLCLTRRADGHGRLVEPPARNTMWRHGFSNPINYNDDEQFCGGITKQWSSNGGKCGVCGDDFSRKEPRDHELGGLYGNGIIVRTYAPGETINVTVLLTTNHKGWMEWRVCPYTEPKREASQKCLDEYLLPMAGKPQQTRYIIPDHAPNSNFNVNILLKLPERLTCKKCVMQWHYYTGNFWGVCANGTGGLGCGPQETYRNCADITIGKHGADPVVPWHAHSFVHPFNHYFRNLRNPMLPDDVTSGVAPHDPSGQFWQKRRR